MTNSRSGAGNLGKGALGVGVGFALYFLIRNLRFGGGFGFGGGPGDREAGTGTPLQPSMTEPTRESLRPKDAEPLLFVVLHPEGYDWKNPKAPDLATRVRRDAVFRQLDLGADVVTPRELYRRVSALLRRARAEGAPPLSLDDVIVRVKAGRRDDVRLVTLGNISQGTWEDVLDALMSAGISHWKLWEQAPADRQASGFRPAEPYKPPKWDLYTKHESAGNPDKDGHYLFSNMGTAYWGLDRRMEEEPPRVSGNFRSGARGYYGGRGYYR